MAIGYSSADTKAKHVIFSSTETKVLLIGKRRCAPSKWISMAGKVGLVTPVVSKQRGSPVSDVVLMGYFTWDL
jgi:hypothetical protein